MLERLWTYQRERFPLEQMALLAAFVGAATTLFSAAARAAEAPAAPVVTASAASALLIFAQMRILDEFKDFADDARFRPYRAVPRGLVTLRELGWIFVVAGAGEVALAVWIDPRLLWLLAAVWGYLFLMTAEFFARDWLRARPLAYLVSHNPIGALIAVYASAFEWLPRDAVPLAPLALLALAVFFDTALLEIGRKIRAPQDEEPGVVTYTAAWGRRAAVLAWYATFGLTAVAGVLAARETGNALAYAALMAPLAVLCGAVCGRYLRAPQGRSGKAIEILSGVATAALYAGLGPVPALLGALA